MVVIDRLSKMIRVILTNTEVTSKGVARLFRDQVWKDFGLPEVVISDWGSQFISNFMRDLYRLLGVTLNPSTAYHPQTDGHTERINQEIEEYLRIFVNYKQMDWADWLTLAEFSYNDSEHSSTKSPLSTALTECIPEKAVNHIGKSRPKWRRFLRSGWKGPGRKLVLTVKLKHV